MTTSDTKYKILVVDDDARLRDLLERYLKQQSFDVYTADGGVQMDELLKKENINLIVLDIMLPGEDGKSICQRLRRGGNTIPIIMLTARGNESDRIEGLEMGADDYLSKPFNPKELSARINAILRRYASAPTTTASTTDLTANNKLPETIKFGDFIFTPSLRILSRKGKTLSLTFGEFTLLNIFIEHPYQAMTRERLIKLSRGRELDVFDRSIDVQISRLRRVIEENVSKPKFIQTIWGVGYVFIPEGK